MVNIYLYDLTANKQDEVISAIDLTQAQLENRKPLVVISETVYTDDDNNE